MRNLDRPRRRGLWELVAAVAVSVAASLCLLVAPALAAPANDQFSARTPLGSTLPVTVGVSNVGATRDPGEPREVIPFGKGRTVWWEWESPSTRWITATTCQSDFTTVLGVFEGTDVEHLTRVTDGNADEVPGCQSSGEAYAFHAVKGRHYVVGVDGNALYGPPLPGEEAHIPSGEGQIVLTLEPTPIPPNDAFENATPLANLPEGPADPFEPPSDRRHLRAEFRGYTFGATKQAGEPNHAGDPGGASVWYSLTPAESGELRLSVPTYGGGGGTLLTLYEGATLATLRPIGAGTGSSPSIRLAVSAGIQYRIAIDGKLSEATGEPQQSAYSLQVELLVLPLPAGPATTAAPAGGQSSSAPATTVAPTTTVPLPWTKVTGRKVDAAGRSAVFTFASVPGAKFSCKLDSGRRKPCTSPYRLHGLGVGGHRLEVFARNAAGPDPTPAVVHFRIPAPHRHGPGKR